MDLFYRFDVLRTEVLLMEKRLGKIIKKGA